MADKPTPPEDDEDHIVPIDFDPAVAEREAEAKRAAERGADSDEELTDLEMAMDMLTAFNVEFTLIQDESGSTIEIEGGNRGTAMFAGLAVTFNFRPRSQDEKFTFIGLAK